MYRLRWLNLNTIKSQLFVQIYLFRAIHRLCTLQREGRSSLRDAWLAQSVLLFFCTTGSSECGDLSGMYTRPGSAGSRWIDAVVPYKESSPMSTFPPVRITPTFFPLRSILPLVKTATGTADEGSAMRFIRSQISRIFWMMERSETVMMSYA